MIREFGAGFETRPPSTMEAICQLETAVNVQLPSSYKEFLLQSNGGVGCVGMEGYLDLCRVEDIPQMYRVTGFKDCCPSFLPIGSDGGGEVLAIGFKGNTTTFGYMPFIDSSEANFIAIHNDFIECIRAIGAGRAF